MEGYDIISDSLSGEIIGVVVLERIWSKISGWLEGKAMDKRLDTMSERIAKLEGYKEAKH